MAAGGPGAEPGQAYPLSGVTVIDLGQIYQGPYATLMMAMAGAEVIKVEPPDGEPLRRRAPVGGGATLPLAMLNSNKRFVTLNLKTERGRELLIGLAKKSDVLLENYAPGTMQRLGVGPEVLMGANPRLIYASGTGYGRTGPDSDRLAMDVTVQAVSGVMSVTGQPDGPPLKAGPAIADFLSGTHLYAAVVTALYDRERTGRGRLVEVAMQEAVFPTLASNLGLAHGAGGARPPRTGNRHGGLSVSPYNVYPTKDGHIAIICISETHWRNLLAAMSREELADDPRFADNASRAANMDETDRLVGAWTAGLTRDRAHALTRRHGVPSAPVRDLTEVIEDRQMHARGMLEWIDHPDLGRMVAPRSPLRFDGAPQLPLRPSARLGADNEEVYSRMLGLDREAIAGLVRDGVI